MRITTSLGTFAALVLSACASTPDAASLGPVDENGFVARAGQDLYHVKSGLYCPSDIGGMLRDTVTVFRQDIDVACNYKSARQEMTVYLYPDRTPTDELMPGVIDAASRGNLGNRVRPSEGLTSTCKTQALARTLMSQVLDMGSDNTITLDPDGGAPGFPYRVGALEGGNTRSYAALVPRENGQMLKLRYSVLSAADEEGRKAECDRLYDAANLLYRSIGEPDGAEPSKADDVMRLLSTEGEDDS